MGDQNSGQDKQIIEIDAAPDSAELPPDLAVDMMIMEDTAPPHDTAMLGDTMPPPDTAPAPDMIPDITVVTDLTPVPDMPPSCLPPSLVCGGLCIDPLTSDLYCGASGDCAGLNAGQPCTLNESCTGGTCTLKSFGSGVDGPLVVDPWQTFTINTINTTADGTSGTSTLVVGAATGLAKEQLILIHQPQGTGAGSWELASIADISGTDLQLRHALAHTYSSAGNNRAQVIVVPQYTSVTLGEGAILTAPLWSGYTGGVLIFKAKGTVTVNGQIFMSARGFAGGARPDETYEDGYQGESHTGPGIQDQAANSGGGGAGFGQGRNCATVNGSYGSSGGGAGYATVGEDGLYINGNSSICTGQGGVVYGTENLSQLFFGSGGGSGGNDDVIFDNPLGGKGGAGGGIIFIMAHTFAVASTGSVATSGEEGQGDATAGCLWGTSTTDCWDFSGPGGGGAGGSIRIESTQLDLGLQAVYALGGAGGLGGNTNGGTAGVGRIALYYGAGGVSGTTNPPAVSTAQTFIP